MTEDIKKVYDPSDIQDLLGLGRTTLYEFLEKVYKEQKPFTVIKVGRLYKIPKGPFNRWISGEA